MHPLNWGREMAWQWRYLEIRRNTKTTFWANRVPNHASASRNAEMQAVNEPKDRVRKAFENVLPMRSGGQWRGPVTSVCVQFLLSMPNFLPAAGTLDKMMNTGYLAIAQNMRISALSVKSAVYFI